MEQLVVTNKLLSFNHIEGEKPTLLFLHGWRSEAAIWNGVIEKLKENGNEIFALDLPGFGSSPTPKETMDVSDYAEVVIEFIKKQKLDRVIIIGHSFGGRIAIKIGAQNPKFIEKIVLVDSGGIITGQSEKYFKRKIAKVFKPFFKPAFMFPIRRKIYKAIGAEDFVERGELKNTFLNIINEDLRPILRDIKLSTLILWGEDDNETPLAHFDIIKNEIASAKSLLIHNAGHFPFIDQKELFCKELIDFIND